MKTIVLTLSLFFTLNTLATVAGSCEDDIYVSEQIGENYPEYVHDIINMKGETIGGIYLDFDFGFVDSIYLCGMTKAQGQYYYNLAAQVTYADLSRDGRSLDLVSSNNNYGHGKFTLSFDNSKTVIKNENETIIETMMRLRDEKTGKFVAGEKVHFHIRSMETIYE